MAFPSITATVEGYSVEKAFDPTIRSRSESGYLKTRTRCTRIPDKWTVFYIITTAQKTLLESHVDSVGVGGTAFTWTDPATSTTHSVRFSEPVKYSTVASNSLWRAQIVVEEV